MPSRLETRPALLFLALLGLAAGAVAPAFAGPAAPAPWSSQPALQDDDAELAAWLQEERLEAQRLIDAGDFGAAKRLLDEHLGEDPDDWRARALRGRLELARARYDRAAGDLDRALRDAGDAAAWERTDAVLDRAELALTLGAAADALARLEALGGDRPRAAFLTGRAHLELGDQAAARAAFEGASGREPGLAAETSRPWEAPYYTARCERALGRLSAASYSLVGADRLANNRSADVLAELASVYFEADGEVALAASAARRPATLYREALELAPAHPASLLGMYALHDLNWRRSSRSARSWLVELLEVHPGHIAGRVTLAEDQLANGEFKGARQTLDGLADDAGARRDVQALEAAYAWTTDKLDTGRATLDALTAAAPWDSAPERLVGSVLIDLYRFGDALEFLERAVERAPDDHRAWTLLGQARANTGDEVGGLAALERAEDAAEGRQDAWRNNVRLVLEKMEKRWIESQGPGRLTYVLPPEGHELLERVLAPFYYESRADLAARYGLTPGPVRIEVFDRHADFSVRSTGFEGFPALGVCFGPVVTALSPLCELRGSFSWAETSYHEFSHVVHLALTRNRCPRWVTEGLATWEEERYDPSWTRNMRRELVDSIATDQVIGVRDLNRAFRGPRIIWAYYQGGLMCELLIERYGFPAMVDFLEAFNDGLELDAALARAFGLTPEELDVAFLAYARELTKDLFVEPRHDPERTGVLAFTLPKQAPASGAERAEWVEQWCDVAWGAFQSGRTVDAQSALRTLTLAGVEHPRAEFLRGHMAVRAGDEAAAREHFDAGFALGGEDFLASMTRGAMAEAAGEFEEALVHFAAAELAFPGWDDAGASAELAQARVLTELGREDEALEKRERYLRWNSGDAATRMVVGAWRLERGTPADLELALEHYTGAVQVDPFQVAAHRGMARALRALERFEEERAALELALLVPLDLDPIWSQASPEARAALTAELEEEAAAAQRAL